MSSAKFYGMLESSMKKAGQDCLMSQADKLELQRRSCSKTEGEEGDDKCDYTARGYEGSAGELRPSRCFSNFE
jgi:hypothetical protein